MSSAVIRISTYRGNDSARVWTTDNSLKQQYMPVHQPVERSYFYKADSFPEVIVNERREYKTLQQSCRISMP